MDDFLNVLVNIPQELIVVIGGAFVSVLTQISKKIRDKFKYDIDTKVLAAFIAIIAGVFYAFVLDVSSDDFLEKVMQFWALAFSGAIAIYELFKSIVKRPISNHNKSFPDKELKLQDPSLIYALVEVERKARILDFDFEEFSLGLIKRGKLTENDLRIHVFSLNERIKIELEKKGERFLSEDGI